MSKVSYYISKDNQFVIENYSQAPTFASFFPGIAGIFGCPMWVFYANRGQGITSAGVQDKDHAIIEFQPANKAYRQTPLQGFRTFIKVDNKFYEPFSEKSQHQSIMRIAPESLTISEENKTLKIRVEVNYFTLPHEPFPALARCVKITNLGSKPRKIELLDGLPMIIPFGFNNDLLKRLSTTIEAWCTVKNLESNAPFFKLKISPNDVSETTNINKGNFFLSFSHQDKQDLPVQLIVDPAQIFCQNSSLEIPCGFLAKGFRPATKQQTCGFTPSAFAFKKTGLAKGAGLELFSLFGQVDSLKALNKIKGQVCNKKYILKKAAENKALIDSICARMEIKSASKNFDLYSKQTFLDNVLRGGLPVKIDHKTIYLYYRKHGDMERDYNDFKLMPTYYSQGNGNYRDINQNRRCDIFFNPDLAEDNILRFFNLVQLDGFNPLVVYGSKFVFESRSKAGAILKKHLKKPTLEMTEQLIKPFALGELLKSFDQAEVIYKTSKEKLAEDLAGSALVQEEASHHEGFWIDHFCYNTDQLESFESIYPEKINQLLFDQKKFTYFDNDHIVVGRAVTADPAKRDLINSRHTNQNIVRKKFGQGTIYHTTLAAKILSIIINKAASFDPEGIGLEMEAGKPDWYDALNGLPALLGSSLSETLELKRLALYRRTRLSKETEISIPVETKRFLDQLKEQLT
ncbi:MAG: hypothetical protein KJ811_04660, partial [Candidatus Margulisbacteria bacterium]|nr:hypothetical protein [Candidatus Margulisiibacteriota bacterium]